MAAYRKIALAILWAGLALVVGLRDSTAQGTDPFDLLFDGPGEIDASADGRAGQDDLIIVELSLERLPLAPAVSAYATASGLCLPFQVVVDALELPISLDDDGNATGWVVDETDPLQIDFVGLSASFGDDALTIEETQVLASEDGWCIGFDLLETVLPIVFDYDSGALKVDMRPTVSLPIQDRLEREAIRARLLRETPPGLPDYSRLENPHRWISWPVADIELSANYGDSGPQADLSLIAAGDVLKSTGRIRTVSRRDAMVDGVRIDLSRIETGATGIGGLPLRALRAGEVSTPSLALISNSRVGRGGLISNRSGVQPDLFDTTEIRGALPEGWEAELYLDDRLVDFVLEPDASGEYVFGDVALQPGLNRFRVKLYGPRGQTAEEPHVFFIGAELNPENATYYSLGVIEEGVSLVSGDIDAETESVRGAYAFASLEHGVSRRVSLRFDAAKKTNGPISASAAAFLSVYGGFGALRIASESLSFPAIQASFQKRLNNDTSVSIDALETGDLENDVVGRDTARTRRSSSLRIDSNIKIGRSRLPIQWEANWFQRDTGETSLETNSRLSGRIRRTAWVHSVGYQNAGGSTTAAGQLGVSRDVSGLRVRGNVDYALDRTLSPVAASVSVQERFRSGKSLEFNVSKSFQDENISVTGALSAPFGPARLSGVAGYRSGGAFAGLSLSAALSRDTRRNRFELAPPGLSRTGAIRARVFDDVDGDGIMGSGDAAAIGARFIVQNALRSEEVGTMGDVEIAGLSPHKPLAVELQLSSIDDPFLAPEELGRIVSIRPGQILDLDFPLLATGEAEGFATLSDDGRQEPVSGVVVQVVRSKDGRVVAEGRSEYDGYFYIEDIPEGRHLIRVSPATLSAVGASAKPLAIEISRQNPGVYDLSLIVRKHEVE
ncbi:MAG: hypothetical protein AAFQ67_00185 [Pseudomonadota bacterium]